VNRWLTRALSRSRRRGARVEPAVRRSGFLPRRLPDGSIESPVNASTEEYCALGITVVVRPGEDGYEELDAWLKCRGR
jgi:hypothetical protein